MIESYFPPRISADTERFWQQCKEHTLAVQRCESCGELRWPAAHLCPHCLSEKAAWADIGSEGTVYSFVVFRKAFHPDLKEKVPYVVAAIDIGGVRMLSNIVNCDPEDIECGAAVRLVWADAEGCSRPVYKLKR